MQFAETSFYHACINRKLDLILEYLLPNAWTLNQGVKII